MPSHHFVKDSSETPDIGSLIDRRTPRLFRRHVRNGSEYRAQVGLNQQERFVFRQGCWCFLFRKLCNPKVEHFYVSVRTEHDVLRLDIAMDNSRLMCGGERTRDLDRDVNGFTQLHSPAHQTLM